MVSRCFPGGYNVKLYISRGRLAWWLLAFLCCVHYYVNRIIQEDVLFVEVIYVKDMPSPRIKQTGIRKKMKRIKNNPYQLCKITHIRAICWLPVSTSVIYPLGIYGHILIQQIKRAQHLFTWEVQLYQITLQILCCYLPKHKKKYTWSPDNWIQSNLIFVMKCDLEKGINKCKLLVAINSKLMVTRYQCTNKTR